MFNTENIDVTKEFDSGIDKAALLIQKGEVVAFPTETVYGLGANALSPEAVAKIFEAKGRPSDNPLIVHVADMEQAYSCAYFTPLAKKLCRLFWPGPFTAVLKKTALIPDCVSAGLSTAGIRMPDNRFALELIRRSKCPIAAPSANKSGSPSPTRALHVYEDMKGRIPLILDGGSTEFGVESTVCDLTGDLPVLLRPGGITAEMLRDAAGGVIISEGLKKDYKAGDTPPSPGMKYKHYAPKAMVIVVSALEGRVLAENVKKLVREDLKNGLKAVILCTEESAAFYEDDTKIILGSIENAKKIAHNLFDALRQSDELGADKVYFEALPETGMGLAVMNRIQRAAAHREIHF